jgi:hypothetical protein
MKLRRRQKHANVRSGPLHVTITFSKVENLMTMEGAFHHEPHPNSVGIQVPSLREPSPSPRTRPFAPAQHSHPSRSHRGRCCLLAADSSYREHQNRTRPPALWRRWARSSSTSSTGSRTLFSTPSAMTPSTCPRLYVAPTAEAPAMQQRTLAKALLLRATTCEGLHADLSRLS